MSAGGYGIEIINLKVGHIFRQCVYTYYGSSQAETYGFKGKDGRGHAQMHRSCKRDTGIGIEFRKTTAARDVDDRKGKKLLQGRFRPERLNERLMRHQHKRRVEKRNVFQRGQQVLMKNQRTVEFAREYGMTE